LPTWRALAPRSTSSGRSASPEQHRLGEEGGVLGDEIQAIKAGILEIADVLVVNKADREGADRSVRHLISMLELRGHDAVPVEIVKTVATDGGGIDDLVAAIDRHRARVAQSSRRRDRRAEALLGEVLLDRLRRAAAAAIAARPDLVEQVASRETDPYSAADALAASLSAVLK